NHRPKRLVGILVFSRRKGPKFLILRTLAFWELNAKNRGMSLENVNDLGRQNPGYETQKGGSAAYGSGFPKILFSRVSNLGFHEKLSNEEILTFLLLRHLPKPGEEGLQTLGQGGSRGA